MSNDTKGFITVVIGIVFVITMTLSMFLGMNYFNRQRDIEAINAGLIQCDPLGGNINLIWTVPEQCKSR